MSTNSQTKEADQVRRAFSGLPLEEKISTLLRIELDMLGDAVEAVVSVASKAIDEAAAAFSECVPDDKSAAPGQSSASEV